MVCRFKIIAVFLICSTITSVSLRSQVYVNLGPEVSMMAKSDYLENTSSILSPRIGLDVYLPFKNGFSLQPGLYYSRRGYDQQVIGEKYSVRLPYISLQLHAEQEFGNSGFFILGGFELSWLGNAKIKGLSFETDKIRYYKSNDIGLVGGLGYAINDVIAFRIFYFHGLKDNLQFDYVDQSGVLHEDVRDLKFRTIGLGIRVCIGEKNNKE